MSTAVTTPTLTAGTWTVDAVHSDVSSRSATWPSARPRAPSRSSPPPWSWARTVLPTAVTAEIDAASVDTKQEQRDAHVRSADFLDVENHPSLTFVSTGVKSVDGEEFVLAGNLTIRGTTQPVDLDVEFLGETVDAYGATRAGFSAKTSISRKSYGVSFDAAFGAGNAVVSDKVEIDLELEFVRNAD